MRFGVKIEKKYAFMIIGAILVLAGAIYGYAQSPSIFGHEFGEINFPTGTIMTFNKQIAQLAGVNLLPQMEEPLLELVDLTNWDLLEGRQHTL